MASHLWANPEVDRLLLEHNNQPLKALYEVLKDKANQVIELPMAIIMDRRCGIERRAEVADGLYHLVGASPLLTVIDAGRVDVANALLAAGADPNAMDANGSNSLYIAARDSNLEAIEFLISYGADINAVDKNGRTTLHTAADWGNASVIQLLERAGANLEVADYDGQTPLHSAALACEPSIIKALIQLGANQAAVDNEGRTPLHCAAANEFGRIDAIEAFRCNVEAFEADLTTVDKNGLTPLQVYGSCPFFEDSKLRALLTPLDGIGVELVPPIRHQ